MEKNITDIELERQWKNMCRGSGGRNIRRRDKPGTNCEYYKTVEERNKKKNKSKVEKLLGIEKSIQT